MKRWRKNRGGIKLSWVSMTFRKAAAAKDTITQIRSLLMLNRFNSLRFSSIIKLEQYSLYSFAFLFWLFNIKREFNFMPSLIKNFQLKHPIWTIFISIFSPARGPSSSSRAVRMWCVAGRAVARGPDFAEYLKKKIQFHVELVNYAHFFFKFWSNQLFPTIDWVSFE